MANNTEKKEFRTGLYAGIIIPVMAALLVVLTVIAFKTRYTAFSPEKVAQTFTDTIVQTGDGYNAYKNTLVSKNQKYGDFIVNAYMAPYVNDGKDVKQADFVGTGSEEEQQAIDNVYNTMYAYFIELLNKYGFDDYDAVFSKYFEKLAEVRRDVYGDEYMSTDFMFGAFESNVETFGRYLTGAERKFASDNKTILQEETIGMYQLMFGTEKEVETDALVDGKKQTVTEKKLVYKLTSTVTNTEELTGDAVTKYVEDYKARITPVAESGENTANGFGLKDDAKESMVNAFKNLDCSEDINAVDKVTVEVTTQDGTVVATQEVYVVCIGNSWYVDNTNVDTSGLYLSNGSELGI